MRSEERRLEEAQRPDTPWKKWGPYLSERQWGTVREDYSDLGHAWDYFSHDQARSRAYRWGEDGLAGLSDSRQQLCFALALWNGSDPIIKERLFGRSAPLPTGGTLEQADGTAWMAFFCQCMLQISVELSLDDLVYQDMAAKFYEHFLWIASAMDRIGAHSDELWDEEDGFFYDVLRLPSGHAVRLKVRSMVGLLSLCASTVFPSNVVERLPAFMARARAFTERHRELISTIAPPTRTG